MKVLFVMKSPGDLRPLGSVVRLLAQRGHRLHLAFQTIKAAESRAALDALDEECPGISFGKLPSTGSSSWTYLARSLRLGIDYLRYLDPVFADATKLRSAPERKAPQVVLRLARVAALFGPQGVRMLRRVLQWAERSIVPSPHVQRFVEDHEPDVFMVTPLVGLASVQADFLRAAKRLGIRTAYPVLSWDNLSSKGLVRDVADLVLVWNEIQAEEARTLQGIPGDRIRVAGATSWDHWFDWPVGRTREEFCREVGLRADRPFILYVGSHQWVISDEVEFVRRWVTALRSHGGLLGDAGILVRPHPQRDSSEWGGAELDDPQVAVWPRFGEEPLGDAARENYFESIHYSSAVVGINTSAQIEAAIVGRPVHTLVSEEFRDTQEGTIHFHYLQDEGSGHLFVAHDLDEHAALLEESLRGGPDDRNERFLRRFARPYGLDVAATPLYVEAIEELAARPAPAPDRGPAAGPFVRVALRPMASLALRAAARRRDAKADSPLRQLRLSVRALARRHGRPVVAGPWLGDEIGELLYWIPFLRWVETANFGLAERLLIVARAETAGWYSGLGGRLVASKEIEAIDADVLPAESISGLRAELAAEDPAARLQRRLLDFAALAPAGLPAGLELPDRFVAVRFEHCPAYPDTEENRELVPVTICELAERSAVVVLGSRHTLGDGIRRIAEDDRVHFVDEADPNAAAAILARACGFVGSYGPTAYAAALLGVPAAALYSRREAIASTDLRVAASFLARPPFGRLVTVEASGPARETARHVADLLEPAGRVLAGAS
jgi:hypothetical protein